jgi:hypothetical protein
MNLMDAAKEIASLLAFGDKKTSLELWISKKQNKKLLQNFKSV